MTRKELAQFAAFTKASNRVLYGEKVAVVRDESDDMLSESIAAPDTERRLKYTGTVVYTGLGITPEHKDLAGLVIGDMVAFNTYNPMSMLWPDKDGGTVKVLIFHAADIYVGWRPDALFVKEDLE